MGLNLLAGRAALENLLMIVFAAAWGFVFTMVYYKSGSLLLCILVHAAVDVLSVVAAQTDWGTWLYIGATVVIGGVCSLYLAKRVGTPAIHRTEAPKGAAPGPQDP